MTIVVENDTANIECISYSVSNALNCIGRLLRSVRAWLAQQEDEMMTFQNQTNDNNAQVFQIYHIRDSY